MESNKKIRKDYEKQQRLSRRQKGWRSAQNIYLIQETLKWMIKTRTRSKIDRYWEGTAFKLHLLKELYQSYGKDCFTLAEGKCNR